LGKPDGRRLVDYLELDVVSPTSRIEREFHIDRIEAT